MKIGTHLTAVSYTKHSVMFKNTIESTKITVDELPVADYCPTTIEPYAVRGSIGDLRDFSKLGRVHIPFAILLGLTKKEFRP